MTRLHVILIGNYTGDRQASMQRFADLMADSLRKRSISMELLRPKRIFSRLAPGDGSLAKWLGYVDKFLVFPVQLRRALRGIPIGRRERTIAHICDHSNSVYVDHLRGWKHVVTCHDLIAIQQASGQLPSPSVRWTGRLLQRWIARGLRRACWIACVSDNTRHDLCAVTGRSGARVATILSQLNEPYSPLERIHAWELLAPAVVRDSRPLVLHVGNNSWYKNRDGVLRIFAKACELAPAARPRLLIIGREFTRKQKDMIAQLGLEADVRRMADASSQQLQAAYSVADVFLFPSLYEGFGWPPIEAQACGCPVVAGAGGSLAEVLGDSALTADAKDETRLAGFVARVLQEPALCEDLRARGLGNVARFRAPRMIDDYVALYERILAESLS